MVDWKKELRVLLHPYFIINMLMSSTYFVFKTVPPICTILFENCNLQVREYEIFIFLACAITIKNKKQVSIPNYMAHFCMFAKISNLVMFFQQNILYAVLYGILWIIVASFLHQPVYRGPDKVLYFRDTSLEEEVFKGDPRVVWLIEFYAAWSPSCVSFAPIFAELSEEYGLDNLKFGKLDVTRYPDVAQKFRINTSSWSSQVPSLILFKLGKEVDRRPAITVKGNVAQKFAFSWEGVVKSFGLNEIYNECKKNPISKKKAQIEKKTE